MVSNLISQYIVTNTVHFIHSYCTMNAQNNMYINDILSSYVKKTSHERKTNNKDHII